MINLFCPYFGMAGYNVHSMNFGRALNRIEPVALVAQNYPCFKIDFNTGGFPMMRQPILASNVSVALTFADRMNTVFGKQCVGYTVWETTKMPAGWVTQLNAMDQVWVPSTWGKQVFIENGVNAEIIQVVPEGVDPLVFNPKTPPLEAYKSDRFTFLYLGRWEERKGTELAIRAYCDAFKSTDSVELIVHAFNPFAKGFDLKQAFFNMGISEHPPIRFVNYMALSQLARLYTSADAFVMPTRAEGWGLPIIEAMASGVPVIVTRYSAPTDFVTEDTGYFIDVERMTEVKDPLFYNPNSYCGEWAVPDHDHLVSLLRHVAEHPDEARATGRRAHAHVSTKFTWARAAEIAHGHLCQLRAE